MICTWAAQDTQDPLANALVQPQLAGILVLELDWFPIRADKREPLILCVAGADGSFRLLEVHKYVDLFYNTELSLLFRWWLAFLFMLCQKLDSRTAASSLLCKGLTVNVAL